jgi:hypothetical protein
MSATTEVPEFTIEQVAAHNREDDLWIIVHGEGGNSFSKAQLSE